MFVAAYDFDDGYRPRRLVNRMNFEEDDEEEFRKRYRLSIAAYRWLLDEVQAEISPLRSTNYALTADQALKLTIRFVVRFLRYNFTSCSWCADGGHFRVVGDSYGITEGTVCRTVHRVIRVIVRVLFNRLVRWPETVENCERIRAKFFVRRSFVRRHARGVWFVQFEVRHE